MNYSWSLVPKWALLPWLIVWNPRTIGCWLLDTSSIVMVNMCPIDKWSVRWMLIWIADKKSGNWMVVRYLWTNIRHLWTIRPISYQTFCLLFRSPFGYQTKIQVTEWSQTSGLWTSKKPILDVSGNQRAGKRMPTVSLNLN